MVVPLRPSASTVVRTCPKCKATLTLQQALTGPELRPIGMAFHSGDPTNNAYYFNHTCGSTLVLPVKIFAPFLPERVSEKIRAGSARCEKHCLHVTDLQTCGQACYFAPYRRFLVEYLLPRRPPPGLGAGGTHA